MTNGIAFKDTFFVENTNIQKILTCEQMSEDLIAENPFSLVVHLSGKKGQGTLSLLPLIPKDEMWITLEMVINNLSLSFQKFKGTNKKQRKSGGSMIKLRHRPSLGTYLKPVVQIQPAAGPEEMPP